MYSYGLLETGPDPAFDRVALLAQRLLSIPAAMVIFVDESQNVCKANVGRIECEFPRNESLCGYAILQSEPLIIPNLHKDPMHWNSPAVRKYGVGFYMGVPLLDDDGLALGTLCLVDPQPRDPSSDWIASAIDFAAVVRDEMTLARAHRKLRQSIADQARSEKRYMDLVTTVPGSVFQLVMPFNGQPRLTFMSEGIRDLCGLDAEEYVRLSESGGTMIHPEDHPLFVEELQVSAESLVPLQWQGRLLSTYGGTRWVQIVARPEFHRNGEVHWSGIITDIGPLKEAEHEIREMNRTLESKVNERTEELHRAQLEMLTRLGKAAEARDDDTGAHIARVARTSGILARGVGMSELECQMIRQAAPMHDIGKISVPDAVLLKPGRLTDEELEVMRQHASEGARMLEGGSTALVRMAEAIARTHHERWDGTGYPNGLKGEEIPLVGRIVAIADVFDALTSERPYKRAWSYEEAVEEIRRGAGRHFDPQLVEIFVASLPEILQEPGETELPAAA